MWDSPLEFLKGVGPQRAALLAGELGMRTVGDLLQHYPFRYVDRSQFYSIREVVDGPAEIQLRGRITKITEAGAGPKKRLVAQFEDGTGTLELVWFQGVKWVRGSLPINEEVVVYGKVTAFQHKRNITHPEVEKWTDFQQRPVRGLFPVYSTTEKLAGRGLHARGLAKLVATAAVHLDASTVPEWLPPDWLRRFGWPAAHEAVRTMHFPADAAGLSLARQRLAFEELFLLQLGMQVQKTQRQKANRGRILDRVGPYFLHFYENELPFELTEAQKRVVREIRHDLRTGFQMNRLLQGDVGSGKTMVAFLTMLLAKDNGLQACLMAPTEILAQQHFAGLLPYAEAMDLHLECLTGSTKTADRNRILSGLADGTVDFVVGTHALIEDRVVFAQLGLAIVDEQHRFGVAQRASLWKKSSIPPHMLVMTATPIPRTLAMSAYGDLDCSVIDELPPGRKPIETVHRTDGHRLKVWGFLKQQIALGRQVYLVYPLIEESETLDYKDLMDGYESIRRDFPSPDYAVSIVHGRMKPADKEYEMQRFVRGETQLMVATTVIEVGVNVPNASVMVIENAERFGLSQLHQLRGRVGRGADQSYCILMTGPKLSDDARTRVETMCRTNDGFEIADVDLGLRGPGDLLGTRQSGLLNFKVARISQDQNLVTTAKWAAETLLQNDPTLALPEHQALKRVFTAYARGKFVWGKIG
jgi:ATP-dependent DNA helicase RecG